MTDFIGLTPRAQATDLTDLLGDDPSWPDNRAVALHWASRGFPVLIARHWDSGGKRKPLKGWPASCDPAQIEEWFDRYPDAVPGLLCAEFVVLDVDVKNGSNGMASLAELGFPNPALLSPVRSRTKSGGLHLFFAGPDSRLKNWVGKIGAGLDVRCNSGGWVVAPGAYVEGKQYVPQGVPLGSIPLPRFPDGLIPEEAPRAAPAILVQPTDRQRTWAAEKLSEAAERVRNAKKGSRQTTQNDAVFYCAGLAAHGAIHEDDARGILIAAALEAGRPEDRAISTFDHAWEDGLRHPVPLRVDVTPDDFDDVPTVPGEKLDWHLEAFAEHEIPDLSQDQQALDLGKAGWNRDARYVAELGGWLLWDGTRWQSKLGMRPLRFVRKFIKNRSYQLNEWAETRAEQLDPAEAEKLLRWAKVQCRMLRQEANIISVERLARSNRSSLSTVDQWDSDDFLLGTPGGAVDLRTGQLKTADRSHYITGLTAVAPAEPGNQPTEWLRFLNQIFPGDPEMPAFMQRLSGYALTGSTREHRFFLFNGSGRNGKGTFLNTLQHIMGDYARGVPTATLLETRNPQHSAALARLRGVRLVRGAELPVGQMWNESLIKQLTGGDPITANMMRQNPIDFFPKFTLIVDGNTKPRIRTTDVAMRSRMTLVPFKASFVGKEDRGLQDRLKAEAPQILRWAIEGAVAWQRDGLGIPEAVQKASQEYLDSEDSLAHFLEEETIGDPAAQTTVGDLFARYHCWSLEQGLKPATKRTFSEMVAERGFDRKKATGGVRAFEGLRLRSFFDD